MPQMLSLRTFRLTTTSGACIQFEANEPKFVPPHAVQAAMNAGCVPVDAKDAPFYEDVGRSKVEFAGDLRKSVLHLAVKAVAEENDTKKFTGGGTPKVDVIEEMVGFNVTAKEVVDAYQIYRQSVAEGVDFPLHPAADNIIRVVSTSSKKDLEELALELFGMEKDQTKGLDAKALRKLLLTKLNGTVASG
jgi:hypothetical protein